MLFLLHIIFILSSCGSTGSTNTSQSKHYVSIINDNLNYFDNALWQKSDWANNGVFYNAWCPNQLFFNNGILDIGLNAIPCHGKTHASGEYRTNNTYVYGKYTARMRASDINGTITAMFVYTGPSAGTPHDEIDIEILGKNPHILQINYWRNNTEHPQFINLGFDASLAMHQYSFVWTLDSIKWYVDNRLVYTVLENHLNNNDSLPIYPGKFIVNLWAATGIDSWSGAYQNGTVAHAYFDYLSFAELR
jgi:beta-glucanase (GH16 family)